MVKKTITYVDPLTDQQVTEDHYFHISKADLLEMEMEEHNAKYTSKDGQELTGMQAHLQRIVDSEDPKLVLGEFKAIVKRAYGRKVNDRFVKSPEIWAEFEGSEAYSEFLFSLLTNAEESASFVNSVVPGNLEQIAKEVAARAEAEEGQTVDFDAWRKEQIAKGEGKPVEVAPALAEDSPPPIDQQVRAQMADSGNWEVARKPVIDAATPENPVDLAEDDLKHLDHQIFKSGLADGRFKLS